MNINTSEVKNLIQENINNTRKREKCFEDCNAEEVNEFDLKVRKKYNEKNINERIEYLSYVIEQIEDVKNIEDIPYESSLEVDALERIGAIIWICIYEDLYNRVELEYVIPEMKKLPNHKFLEKYANENFKHNSKLYLLIANAAKDFNFLEDEECIESKIKTNDEVGDEFLEKLKDGSVREVRQYIKEKKTKKIAEAILDTRVIKYLSHSNKKNKPTITSTEKKITEVYENILNKNQTKSVLKTVNILFNKTKYKDRLEDPKQLKNLQELVFISLEIENEKNKISAKNVTAYLETFFNLLKNYLGNTINQKTEKKVLLMIVEGLVQSKETNFYKNSIFISQLYKYIYGKNDSVAFNTIKNFKDGDCIQDIKDTYSLELRYKNSDDDSRTIINRLYNNRGEMSQFKFKLSSAKYILNYIVDYLIEDYIEIQIINHIEKDYYTYPEEYKLIQDMDIKTLLNKFNIENIEQEFYSELEKYFRKVKNNTASKKNYVELIKDKSRLIKKYLLNNRKITTKNIRNLNELIFWLDHNWWGIRNMKQAKLLTNNTDEIIMNILLQGKQSIEYYEEEKRLYVTNESFYLFIIMLQSMMGVLYFSTSRRTNISTEDFSRGKERTSSVVLGEKLERDRESFERLSQYILNENVDYSKINHAIIKAKHEMLLGDIEAVDRMLGLLSDKTYASIELQASMNDIFREIETEHIDEED